MPEPVASVLLPTHDRPATLELALASVQAQDERDLEILLVLDGAGDATRAIAARAAARDGRIRVFDLPKAPGHGKANIDFALGQARGERIFYIDDDDLWLPAHVRVLGACLQEADIADSRVASVGVADGRIHLAACRGGAPHTRAQLADYVRKDLFDTHIAHTRGALARFAADLGDAPSSRPVWDFLAAFARDPRCRWASTDAVTALSLHGAARRHLAGAVRGVELDAVARDLAADTVFACARVDRLFYWFNLLDSAPPGDVPLAQYAAMCGVHADVLDDADCVALFALFAGAPPPAPVAARLCARLGALVVATTRFEAIAQALARAYGDAQAEAICAQALRWPGPHRFAMQAAFAALVARRDPPQARHLAETARRLGPDPVDEIGRWLDRLLPGAA